MKINLQNLLNLMKKKDLIRNVGILAHVDHGKSTLSDIILSEAGFIAKSLAGRLLYLDFLDEEKRRGITIKTAAISIPMKVNSKFFLLNLVDTPGHVDFSGKVSRALRIIDGAIIVVDAAEGIMSQTEYVLREVIREKVKPILYINKMDRLVRELNYSENQILNRLEEIVYGFNQLIDAYAEEGERNYYRVNVNNETVFFGSALYGWGFTVKTALDKEMKMKDIIKIAKEDAAKLKTVLALGPLVTRLIFEKLPSPLLAQKFRIPSLWTGGEPPESILNCSTKSPTIVYISKVTRTKNGLLCTGRVFSGELKKGLYLDLTNGKNVKVLSVGVPLGSSFKVVNSIEAGNIAVFLTDIGNAGMTLSNEDIGGYFIKPFYAVSPVIYVALTPVNPREFERLIEALKDLVFEDPNLQFEVNRDTGQILLWGVGELQLELAVKSLQTIVELYSSEPIIAYKEAVIQGAVVENEKIVLKLEPLKEIERGVMIDLKNELKIEGVGEEERSKVEPIMDTFLKNGPLVGEPIINLRLHLKAVDKKVGSKDILDALTEAFTGLRTALAEPYYQFEVITKPEYIGSVTNELNRRRGQIEKVLGEESGNVSIKGIIPVRTSLKLSSTLRETTHGNAYIQLRFHSYMLVEGHDMDDLVREIKARKGFY